MTQATIDIFSWNRAFLPDLKQYLMDLTDGQPGKAVIITPNRRPGRYLTHLLAAERKGMILPRMITISDMVAMWRAGISEAPMKSANLLDQAALLYECVRMEAQNDDLLAQYFDHMDMAAFLPWAIRLARVLEDFNVAGRPLDNIQNMEGQTSEPAAALLAALQKLGNSFTGLLQERNWTTDGHDHVLAGAHADEIPRLLQPHPDRPVLIAGFHRAEKVQEKLLRRLWEQGAKVCLHTDPALALGGKIHPAAEWHAEWLKDWKARPLLYGDAEEAKAAPNTRYSFFAGYDLHSQLEQVGGLVEAETGKSTAIILGKPEALMATLQNLPPANVNVSMGYPMERTPLLHLLEDLLSAGQHRKDEQTYRAEDILKIARHPFLSMAKVGAGENGSLFWPLNYLDNYIRSQGRYWRPADPLNPKDFSSPEEAEAVALASREIAFLVNLFALSDCLAGMAKALQELVDWLKKYCGKGWAFNNPLDAEALYRMENEITPVLANNLLAQQKFELPVLGDIVLEIVKEQRIPFEADPIEGLQVMGLLESRLLHFDKVIFVDATDDVLPGSYAQDALLPDSLRVILGLPSNASRQEHAAYNLHRLAANAEQMDFIWQESRSKSSASEGKKIRSRFMEQLIWETEKRQPELVREDRSIVSRPVPRLQAVIRGPQAIERSAKLTEAIERFWKKPVGVTWLDAYLSCPAKFIYEHVLGLSTNDKSGENIHRTVGTFVHELLKRLYGPAPKEELRGTDDAAVFEKRVRNCFAELAKEERLEEKIPLVSFLDLEATIPARLLEYRRAQPEKIFVVGLESRLDNALSINGENVFFKGIFDRLDERGGKLYLTDFKTGRLPLNQPDLWDNEEFFAKVEDACARKDFIALDELFTELRANVGSVQLALYLLLLLKSEYPRKWGSPGNACWVSLTRGARETNIFSSDLEGEDDARLKHCLQAIDLINAHMRLAPQCAVDETQKACGFCDFAAICWR